MSYKDKYQKYKSKYLNLKYKLDEIVHQIGGVKITGLSVKDGLEECVINRDTSGYENLNSNKDKILSLRFVYEDASGLENNIETKLKIETASKVLGPLGFLTPYESSFGGTKNDVLMGVIYLESPTPNVRSNCILLTAGPNKNDQIYLSYINSNPKCFLNITDREKYKELQVGTLLMYLFIEISKYFNFKYATLKDNSTIKCGTKDRGFSKFKLVSDGNSWYANFGFVPYDDNPDKERLHVKYYNDVKDVYNKPIRELFLDELLDKVLRETVDVTHGRIASNNRPNDFIAKLTNLIDELKRKLIERPTMQFVEFTKNMVKSNCINELVLLDLIEDGGLLESTIIGRGFKTSVYEKMKLNL